MSTGPRKLPPGTGPGTSGKPAPPQESSPARGKGSTGFANAPVDPDKEPDSHERGTATGRSANQGSSAARGAGPTGSASRPHGAPLGQARGAQPITKPGQLTAGTGANESEGEGGPREAPPSTTQQTSVDHGSVSKEFDSGAVHTGVNRSDVQNRDMTSSSPPRPPGLTPPGVQSEEAISDHPLGGNQLGDSHKASGIQVIPHPHTTGHSQATTAFAESDDQTLHETHQLNPVTHERVRHVEVEEVTRQKEHDRHIHHIQHHTQPVVVSDTHPEQHHDRVHPITNIQERHANSTDERDQLEAQVRQKQDSVEHEPKERVIVDKGTKIHENVQHHVHHVVQPIIEKESIDRSRIHTVIPIHQVSHEIPVVREPRILAPVSIDGIVETQAGTMSGDLGQAQAGDTAHHCSSCTCGVGKLGESLDRDLRVGDSAPGLSTNRGSPNESPEDGH